MIQQSRPFSCVSKFVINNRCPSDFFRQFQPAYWAIPMLVAVCVLVKISQICGLFVSRGKCIETWIQVKKDDIAESSIFHLFSK